jgi:hypothetical protein
MMVSFERARFYNSLLSVSLLCIASGFQSSGRARTEQAASFVLPKNVTLSSR